MPQPVRVCADHALVVNKSFPGDRKVVVSFDVETVRTSKIAPGTWADTVYRSRDAIGLTPKQARQMARALVERADDIEFESMFEEEADDEPLR